MTKKILALGGFEAEIKTHVAVLNIVGASFVVRYFEAKAANPAAAAPLDALSALEDTGGVDLVLLENEVFYTAAAFPEKEFSAGSLFAETAQHWIGPSLKTAGTFGHGEVYDFAALVAPVSLDCKPVFLYNHFALGNVVKASVRRTGRLRNTYAHLTFVAVGVDETVNNWAIVRGNVPSLAFIDRTEGSWETAPVGFTVLDLLPSVQVTAPLTVSHDSYADVAVQTKNQDGSVYPYTGDLFVDAVSGYATKNRVTITAGQGQLRVMPLGLNPGDSVRVKLNTRTITGMADISIPVT